MILFSKVVNGSAINTFSAKKENKSEIMMQCFRFKRNDTRDDGRQVKNVNKIYQYFPTCYTCFIKIPKHKTCSVSNS